MKPILTKDTRWLTNVEPINFQAREIVFYDMKITWNFAKAIEQMVKWDMRFVHKNTKKVNFSEHISLYDMAGNYFALEYTDSIQRDSTIKKLKETFEHDEKEIFAKKIIENWLERQIPEYLWKFDYDWKYYIIINWLNRLSSEINPEKWVYKWVIVNPNLYYWGSRDISKVQNKVLENANTAIEYA